MLSSKLEKLILVGREIARQKDYAKMFHLVVEEARSLLDAEGGTLYLYDEGKHCLPAVVVLNKKIGIAHSIKEFEPTNVHGLFSIVLDEDKSKPQGSIAGESWRRKEIVLVPDTGNAGSFDLKAMKHFDSKYSYKSKSIVAVPLLSRGEYALGVVQLVNPSLDLFTDQDIEIMATMVGYMGLAVENNLLLLTSENLLNSVVEMVSAAIDEKSKATGGHCYRVTELTMMLAKSMVEDTTGRYRDFSLTEEEFNELRVASLLHDVGKIVTPDLVMDKSRKLEKKVDKIDFLRLRHELRQEYLHTKRLEAVLQKSGIAIPDRFDNKDEQEDFKFLESVNVGGEFIDESALTRLREIASRETPVGPLIEEEDRKDLEIKRGTLNPAERKIMENHVATSIRLLEKLPWPKNLSEVPEIAGKHHENCDGSGYPRGIKADSMSMRAKILCLTDRFDGLSASDRTYRQRKTLAQVLRIMEDMSSKNQIDPELFKFFVEQKVHLEYAREFMQDETFEETSGSDVARG